MISERFQNGDRVVILRGHPWESYAGEVVGPWPNVSASMDWLVTLDNGQNIGVSDHHLQRVPPERKGSQ